MLRKKDRLTTESFTAVIASGKTYRVPTGYLKVIPGDVSAFAIAVPKKVVKSAVRRHLIKRRVFSALRPIAGQFPVGHYVFFVTSESAAFSVDAFTEMLTELAKTVATSLQSRL
ncbi:MAG: Ribonuclease [Candidatus Parcubacteria bacterium]|jgi:ribonuclease P protein component